MENDIQQHNLNIYQRINRVMSDVQYIQKDKQVSGGGANYKAVTHDQVVSAVRPSLVKHGIAIVPSQVSGEFLVMRDLNASPQPVKMGLYTGSYEISFVNIDDPNDRVSVNVQAHASDNGDKAPGKAMTYAVKTAVVKQFYFETGENDESRAEVADVDFINDAQISELWPLLVGADNCLNKLGEKLARAYRFNSLQEIKSSKFQEILKKASA